MLEFQYIECGLTFYTESLMAYPFMSYQVAIFCERTHDQSPFLATIR